MPYRLLILVCLSLCIAPAVPPERACPDEMVRVPHHNSCIDRFEFPNSRGTKPYIAMSALPEPEDKGAPTPLDAVTLCDDTNSKRLCTREEWVAACFMPGGWSQGDCNDDKLWRFPDEAGVQRRDPKALKHLDQREPSGARAKCVSKAGAHDMRGNVEEWVRCAGSGTGYCLMGRYWAEPVSCKYTVSHHVPRWHYYETGFRCCQDL